MNFNHLYYFHVVATEGSIAKAAAKLGLTQPTISEQLRELERSLGEALFDRTPSGLKITAAGSQAYQHTSVMFGASERLLEVLGRDRKRAIAQTLRVGVTASVGRGIAADFLTPVLSLDDCTPSIRDGEFTELLRQLRGLDLDLLLCDTQPVEAAARSLEVVPIHRPRLVGVAAPSMVNGNDGGMVWDGVPLIHYRPSAPAHWEIESFFERLGAKPRVVGETDDPMLMIEAAARGLCVGFVPRSMTRDAVTTGRVAVVAALPPNSSEVLALYHDGETSSLARRAVEALVDYAHKMFDADDETVS
jgi:LysR family transcriptional regulator, transcriptional activator of nhaA